MKPRTTYLALLRQKQEQEEALRLTERHLAALPGIDFIKEAEARCGIFDEPATVLANALVDRDEPMTAAEIRAVFLASGLEFCERHVSEACPDSAESVREQREYYGRHA